MSEPLIKEMDVYYETDIDVHLERKATQQLILRTAFGSKLDGEEMVECLDRVDTFLQETYDNNEDEK